MKLLRGQTSDKEPPLKDDLYIPAEDKEIRRHSTGTEIRPQRGRKYRGSVDTVTSTSILIIEEPHSYLNTGKLIRHV